MLEYPCCIYVFFSQILSIFVDGDDYEDIAEITIVSGCVEITRIILDTHDQDSVDEKLEDNLHHLHNENTVEEKF